MFHIERDASPAQIRARAALVFRNRMRGAPTLRAPSLDETPLSLDEKRLAYALGVASPAPQRLRKGEAQ